MHFTWEITFGQVMLTVPVSWLVIMIFRMYQLLLNFRIEHEMLMIDWAERQVPKKHLADLPTRRTRWW